ncbi:MAG: hypothetical protein K8I03_10450 [Ignavibacteria bacterium]|nr:hypothetical protein [Ignavibacteria bacterium]
MPKFKFFFILILLFPVLISAQAKKDSTALSRFELSFHVGYSRPMLEAYGDNVTINSTYDRIFVAGESILTSPNLGTNTGYTVQTYLKYSLFRKGYVKVLLNLGYNILYGIYPGGEGYDIGVRVQTFSAGIGSEINPLGHEKKFYPGIFGLLRLNLLGGETFHKAGLSFFKVIPRYGYSAGIKLNYRLKKTIALFLGYSYTYDNLWSKQTAEVTPVDDHVIVFRDEASTTNGLKSNRRVVYWSLFMGMNVFFK